MGKPTTPFTRTEKHAKAVRKNYAIRTVCCWQSQVKFIAPYANPAITQRIQQLFEILEKQIREASAEVPLDD